jgi:hypothetical protein
MGKPETAFVVVELPLLVLLLVLLLSPAAAAAPGASGL